MRQFRSSASLLSLLGVFLLLASCKSTDDYLVDLATLDPAPVSGSNFLKESAIIFDAGQLAHEAFAALASAEDMKFWQAITSLSHACNFLGTARDKPLIQGDAAMLIGIILSRVPIPPVTDELIPLKDNEQLVYENLKLLIDARTNLQIPGYIAGLDSPDEVQKIEALQSLQKKTGQDFGNDPEAWQKWYDERSEGMIAEYVEKSKEPLRFLGSIRWERGGEVRRVLKILSFWINQYARPEVEEYYVPCIMNIARQTAVITLTEAMGRNRHVTVRSDVAQAMSMILDPAFGYALVAQLPLERNSYAAAKMIRALKAYPSRKTIQQVIGTMANEDPLISQNAAEVLFSMTGKDFKRDRDAWESWWIEEGSKLWP